MRRLPSSELRLDSAAARPDPIETGGAWGAICRGTNGTVTSGTLGFDDTNAPRAFIPGGPVQSIAVVGGGTVAPRTHASSRWAPWGR